MNISINDLINIGELNKIYTVCGWVRTKRGNKQIIFIAINDGSCFENLQVVSELDIDLKDINTGCSIQIKGKLIESKGVGQKHELIAQNIQLIGEADPDLYPIQPKAHSFEFLREKGHLRFRTTTFSSVFRLRHAVSFSIHQFFQQ